MVLLTGEKQELSSCITDTYRWLKTQESHIFNYLAIHKIYVLSSLLLKFNINLIHVNYRKGNLTVNLHLY